MLVDSIRSQKQQAPAQLSSSPHPSNELSGTATYNTTKGTRGSTRLSSRERKGKEEEEGEEEGEEGEEEGELEEDVWPMDRSTSDDGCRERGSARSVTRSFDSMGMDRSDEWMDYCILGFGAVWRAGRGKPHSS